MNPTQETQTPPEFDTRRYRFVSDLELPDLAALLDGAHGLTWLTRRFRAEYLTTKIAESTSMRGRIDVGGPSSDRRTYELAVWTTPGADSPAEGLLSRIGGRDVTRLPDGPAGAGAECAAFRFGSELSIEQIRDRLKAGEGLDLLMGTDRDLGPYLHAVVAETRRGKERWQVWLEETRWRIRRAAGGFALEVAFDSNPYDEGRWRQVYQRANALLEAVSAQRVAEPTTWRIDVHAVMRSRAWTFSSPMSLAELKTALDRSTDRVWRERDSEHYGDYLAVSESSGYAHSSRARIYQDGGRYRLEVRWQSEAPDADASWLAFEQWLKRDVLTAAGAADVEEAEPHD